MRICALMVIVALLVGSHAGCSVKPVSRMDAYVGAAVTDPSGRELPKLAPTGAPIDAVLVLINDTVAPDSAPPLSNQAKAFLTNQAKQRIEGGLPIKIVEVLDAPQAGEGTQSGGFLAAAREQKRSYVILAVFSSAESEVPTYLPLTGDPEQGGTRPEVPGFEAINYALAELALVKVETGTTLIRSDGRAWTRLNRLYAPVASNAYPVIHRSGRVAPIYPKEENAKDILRSIAGDEALEQAVMHLQEAWTT